MPAFLFCYYSSEKNKSLPNRQSLVTPVILWLERHLALCTTVKLSSPYLPNSLTIPMPPK